MGVAAHERDVDEILDRAGDDLRALRGARIYVTGGTGFIGRWLARAVLHANRRLDTAIRLEVLSRDPEAFLALAPDIAGDSAIRLRRGDVTAPPADGAYDGVIHAATEASAHLNESEPKRMLGVIVDGMRALIERVIVPSGAVPVLFTSSGAVYGRQPPDLMRVAETYAGAPDCLRPGNAYHEGKRLAELMLAIAGERGVGAPKVARLFAFLGPGLPQHIHFAAGNFIRDVVRGDCITVRGDGSPIRSYLYPTDMAVWLFGVFVRGEKSRAYNVGSPAPLSIRKLAEHIAAAVTPAANVVVERPPDLGVLPERYVPDVSRALSELGVAVTVPLAEAIARTVAFYKSGQTF